MSIQPLVSMPPLSRVPISIPGRGFGRELDSKRELHFTKTLTSSESGITFVPYKPALNLNG